MKAKKCYILSLFIIVSVCLLFGCANRTKELIAQDYKQMSDEELLRYYYVLNDEIEKSEKPSGPQFGLGIGGIGSHVGMGMSTGTTGYTATELRDRRIEVRMDLNKRGIVP